MRAAAPAAVDSSAPAAADASNAVVDEASGGGGGGGSGGGDGGGVASPLPSRRDPQRARKRKSPANRDAQGDLLHPLNLKSAVNARWRCSRPKQA